MDPVRDVWAGRVILGLIGTGFMYWLHDELRRRRERRRRERQVLERLALMKDPWRKERQWNPFRF